MANMGVTTAASTAVSAGSGSATATIVAAAAVQHSSGGGNEKRAWLSSQSNTAGLAALGIDICDRSSKHEGYGRREWGVHLRSVFYGEGIDQERTKRFGIKSRHIDLHRNTLRDRVASSKKVFPKWFCKTAPVEILRDARCMDEVYDALAKRLLEAALRTPPKKKQMVALAGTPGAGKSTVANAVCDRLNLLAASHPALQKGEVGGGNPGKVQQGSDIAIALPMDGFHLYRWQLDKMEDPQEAHARRGAPWTFNPRGLVDCLKKIRQEGEGYLPSFDHGVGDPIEEDIFVAPHHRVVIVEGNYMLLAEGEWSELQPLFDELWFLECDIDEAMERVRKRHIGTGKTPEVAKWRVDYNDRPNAELVVKTIKDADVIIPSIAII